jgi:uracil-DNA glycosylase
VELARCAAFLDREIELLTRLRVVLALGRVAWDATLDCARRAGSHVRPRPAFGHGAETRVVLRPSGPSLALVGSYHPSQQNTQTGRLTRPMMDRVMRRAVELSRA